MSGKEAQIYLVVAQDRICAAKVYKEAQNRSFKHRADYMEGRSVRNTRDQRAMKKGSAYGKGKDEEAWRTTEVDMIYRLHAAGVRVPEPHTFIDGVLLMELVTDVEGNPAPRLGDLSFTAEEATDIYHHLLREVTRMLCAGVIHGDLSDFNVLLGAAGPVVIDFPQSINAASNQNARWLLLRDVANLHRFLGHFVPNFRPKPYGEELWALYENNNLTPDTKLTGRHRRSSAKVDTTSVLELISDANQDEERRRRRTGQGQGPARVGQLGRKPKTRPKRGDGAQTSTYVSPSARKSTFALTPRNGTEATSGASANSAKSNGRTGKRRRRQRSRGARSESAATQEKTAQQETARQKTAQQGTAQQGTAQQGTAQPRRHPSGSETRGGARRSTNQSTGSTRGSGSEGSGATQPARSRRRRRRPAPTGG